MCSSDLIGQGADFGTLALKLSDDPQKREGGLLPPFGKGFPHPVAEEAMRLQRGQLSPVFARKVGDTERYYLAYCLDRIPGRDEPFDRVRDEIDRELQQKPLTSVETNAYTLRWRASTEVKTGDTAGEKR